MSCSSRARGSPGWLSVPRSSCASVQANFVESGQGIMREQRVEDETMKRKEC
jgi:hypothetical protein